MPRAQLLMQTYSSFMLQIREWCQLVRRRRRCAQERQAARNIFGVTKIEKDPQDAAIANRRKAILQVQAQDTALADMWRNACAHGSTSYEPMGCTMNPYVPQHATHDA